MCHSVELLKISHNAPINRLVNQISNFNIYLFVHKSFN